MLPHVREPARLARRAEDRPRLPPGTCERVSGYGVMGVPFASGHVPGLRRWKASWHRNPAGRWRFYETAPSEAACTGYFGRDVDDVRVVPIALEREDERRLRVSRIGSALPLPARRSRPVLTAHVPDFYIPQRGIFAVGRVFVTPVAAGAMPADATTTEVSR